MFAGRYDDGALLLTTAISFADLGLADPLLRAIADAGYHHADAHSGAGHPHVLAGGDLLAAAAQTGTGKAGRLRLPILNRLLATLTQRTAGRPRS